MNRWAARALVVFALLLAVVLVLHLLGLKIWPLLLLAILVALAVSLMPAASLRALETASMWLRERSLASIEGRHHTFNGVPLRLEDDGLHMWVDGPGFMRALGRVEPEPALAARHSGRWQRAHDGTLMLRVDAVVAHLASMPGRDDPKVQRLRRYFEREVLFPADKRHGRR